MRDYKETSGLLRGLAVSLQVIDSDYAQLCDDGADAIEELLARDVVPTDFHERCLQLEIRKRFELEKQLPHWISVEERLPKKDETVIVYYSWTGQSGTEYKEVSLATLEEIRYCGSKLLGWMPLPEPPKEDAR